ncbi:MAG: UTP--glucose-1-phosphate uridylyltransferase [Acidobacteria bacterium]|nr:UTP--glucose-1-phosphate uridylyltransferase [Acidobacteriota bacterium]
MKGVIVAAGYGTRLLPFTKTVPKELIPLVDRPAISFILDEFVDAGIEEVLIIGSRRKKSLEDFLDREVELEKVFHEEHRDQLAQMIKPPALRTTFVRQQQMNGTGHALLLAQSFAGNEPVIVAYPDDLFMGAGPNPSQQLVAVHQQTGGSVLAVLDMPGADVSRFGVVAPDDLGPPIKVKQLVEKPNPGTEPSRLVSLGRYVFTPELFSLLEHGLSHHQGGEYYHIHAINQLGALGRLFAVPVVQTHLDVGDRLSYAQAFIRYALSRSDLKEPLKALVADLLSSPQ